MTTQTVPTQSVPTQGVSTQTVSATSSVTRAVRPDGFVDFYELLGVPGNASSALVRSRINDLYNEAQTNREHRQIVKRREADMMLDLLPHCRLVLLHDSNRISYDAYAAAARANAAPKSFETFMNSLLQNSEADGSRAGLLGFRDEPVAGGRTQRSSGATTTRIVDPEALQVRTSKRGSWWAVSGAFSTVFVLLDLALQQPPAATIAASILGGGLMWMATARPGGRAPQVAAEQ